MDQRGRPPNEPPELRGTLPTSEAFVRSVLEHVPDFVVQTDLDGRLQYINRIAPGLDIARIGDHTVYDFLPDEAKPIARACIERVVASRVADGYESAGIGAHGEPRHYLAKIAPIIEAGEVTSLVLVATDVTDLKRAELAHRDDEERLRVALEATGVGMWSWDLRDGRLEWDDTVCHLFGTTRAAAPTDFSGLLARVHPDDRLRVADTMRQSLDQVGHTEVEHRIVRDDGTVRWVLTKGRAIREDSEPFHVVGCVLDTSHQQVLTERLLEAQKLEAIGQLAAGIAHNFNNMLSAILPNVEIALRSAAPADQGPLVSARDAAMRAAGVVKELMVLAGRHGASGYQVHDLGALARRTVEMCRVMFDRRLSIVVDLPDGFNVLGDASQIEQVLLNALLNARDAVAGVECETPFIRVTIDRAIDETPDGRPSHSQANFARLRVIDNGVGMDEATRARVFEPFFTTKPPGSGTGLGLATVQAIAREHGGWATLSSQPGKGTELAVILPLAAVSAEAPPPRAWPTTAAGSETILLADDEDSVRNSLAAVLRAAGYRVLEAADGLSALDQYKAHQGEIDLVLVDQSMPRMSGQALLGTLLGIDADVRAISITGYGVELKGARASLDKPVSADVLLTTIRRVLDES